MLETCTAACRQLQRMSDRTYKALLGISKIMNNENKLRQHSTSLFPKRKSLHAPQ